MKKKLKKYGNSLVITFDPEEIEWYNFKEGDWIYIGNLQKVYPDNIEEENNGD